MPWADAEEQAPSGPEKNNVNPEGSDRLKHKKGTAVLLTRAAPKRSPTQGGVVLSKWVIAWPLKHAIGKYEVD